MVLNNISWLKFLTGLTWVEILWGGGEVPVDEVTLRDAAGPTGGLGLGASRGGDGPTPVETLEDTEVKLFSEPSPLDCLDHKKG